MSSARVDVEAEPASAVAAEPGPPVFEMAGGLLALVGVARDDDESHAELLASKLAHLRVFEDSDGRMNQSLLDGHGSLGIVSQFTLLADARKGRRPSFAEAAPAEQAEPLVEHVAACARDHGVPVVCGRFRAMMRVSLVNEGPVTILLDTHKRF